MAEKYFNFTHEQYNQMDDFIQMTKSRMKTNPDIAKILKLDTDPNITDEKILKAVVEQPLVSPDGPNNAGTSLWLKHAQNNKEFIHDEDNGIIRNKDTGFEKDKFYIEGSLVLKGNTFKDRPISPAPTVAAQTPPPLPTAKPPDSLLPPKTPPAPPPPPSAAVAAVAPPSVPPPVPERPKAATVAPPPAPPPVSESPKAATVAPPPAPPSVPERPKAAAVTPTPAPSPVTDSPKVAASAPPPLPPRPAKPSAVAAAPSVSEAKPASVQPSGPSVTPAQATPPPLPPRLNTENLAKLKATTAAPQASPAAAQPPAKGRLNEQDLGNFQQVLANNNFNKDGKKIERMETNGEVIKIKAGRGNSKEVRAFLTNNLKLDANDFQKVKQGFFARIGSALGLVKDEYVIKPGKIQHAMDKAGAQRYMTSFLSNIKWNTAKNSLKVEGNQINIKPSYGSANNFEKILKGNLNLREGIDYERTKKGIWGKDTFTLHVDPLRVGNLNAVLTKQLGVNPPASSQGIKVAPADNKAAITIAPEPSNLHVLAAKHAQQRAALKANRQSMGAQAPKQNGQAGPAVAQAKVNAPAPINKSPGEIVGYQISKTRPAVYMKFAPNVPEGAKQSVLDKIKGKLQEKYGDKVEATLQAFKDPATGKETQHIRLKSTDKSPDVKNEDKIKNLKEPLKEAMKGIGPEVKSNKFDKKAEEVAAKNEEKKHHHMAPRPSPPQG